MEVAIRIKDGVVTFICDLNPEPPVNSICRFFILFVWRILIDEISNVLIDHGRNPS